MPELPDVTVYVERLTALLAEQMAKGAELDAVIREKLGGMGYAV